MLTVYGIKQCDTCRKVLKQLSSEGIEHRFHDLRADGIEQAMVEGWLGSSFAEQLINRRSTTWRTLDDDTRNSADLTGVLLEHPTLVKRPVFERDGRVVGIGFSKTTDLHALGSQS